MDNQLKVGDSVRLKSGGPVMTINLDNKDSYHCQWFDGKKLSEGHFSPEALVKVEPGDDNGLSITIGSFV